MFGLPAWAAYSVAVAAVLGLVWGHGYMTGRDEKTVAVARAITFTEQKYKDALAKEKQAHETRLAEALEAARAEPDTPVDLPQRRELCRKSPTCRDQNRGQ